MTGTSLDELKARMSAFEMQLRELNATLNLLCRRHVIADEHIAAQRSELGRLAKALDAALLGAASPSEDQPQAKG